MLGRCENVRGGMEDVQSWRRFCVGCGVEVDEIGLTGDLSHVTNAVHVC